MGDWLSGIGYWMEHHPGSAAWAQAVGATFAVVAAVLVPALQAGHAGRQREADRRLRSRRLAIAVYPELLHIPAAHRHIRRRLRELLGQRQGAEEPSRVEIAGAEIADERKRLTIPITETLHGMVQNFYLLGKPIGPEVQRCGGRSMKYNDLLNVLFGLATVHQLPKLLGSIEIGLKQVETCIAGIEAAWQVAADEANAMEEYLADHSRSVRMTEFEIQSKERV